MKRCELCDSLAKVYCESDQANLCWDCDANVHSANFLVAKHSRSLLCHVCQSLTPWSGSGPKLGPTLSVCNECVSKSSCREERRSEEDEEGDSDDGEEDGDEEEDSDEDEENGDGGNDLGGEDEEENQVVPWSSTPPPPVSSPSNNSEGYSGRFCDSGGGE
ncbi:hypothetical protein OIU76_026096 [Salix suchowensis]|nr:hypothetical protein OIU76_026096 [Salix suchowensis]